MDVKLVVENAILEKESENKNLEELNEKLQTVLCGLNVYVNDDSLQSDAYAKHKEYIENMQLPTIKGIVELVDRLIKENNKYMSILTEYFPTGEIDQEYWESVLNDALAQYENMSQTYQEEKEENQSQLSYYEQTYGTINETIRPEFMMELLQQQMGAVYSIIQFYQERLQKLDDMNTEMYELYYDVEYLKPFVDKAINQLNSILISENGYYAICSADNYVFETLNYAMLGLDIGDLIRESLGEEALQAIYAGILTEEEQQSIMVDAVNIASAFLPSCSMDVAHLEIPVGPGFTVYFENTVTTDIGEELPVSWDVSLGEDAEYLASNAISLGDFEVSLADGTAGLQFETEIDGNSTAYGVIGTEYDEGTLVLEYGVSTAIEGISQLGVVATAETAVAVGATISPQGGNWQNDEVASTAYASCYEPYWELETYDINALDGDIVTDIDYDALFVTHVNEENPQDVFVGFMIIGALLSIGGPGGAAILVIP